MHHSMHPSPAIRGHAAPATLPSAMLLPIDDPARLPFALHSGMQAHVGQSVASALNATTRPYTHLNLETRRNKNLSHVSIGHHVPFSFVPPAQRGCSRWVAQGEAMRPFFFLVRLSMESGNLKDWNIMPLKCVSYVRKYMLAEGQYWEDSKVVALTILDYVKMLKLAGDGMDAWVFDINETLLSNIPYFQHQDFGGNGFDSKTFKAWVLKMKAPALPSSLLLYNSLLARGFKIFLLTGRDESLRNGTVHNLFQAGYKGWAGLILRGKSDQGTSVGVYKPKKRGELVKKGYRLWGSVGDQWNDMIGPYQASRSFKLPNPMYYVS